MFKFLKKKKTTNLDDTARLTSAAIRHQNAILRRKQKYLDMLMAYKEMALLDEQIKAEEENYGELIGDDREPIDDEAPSIDEVFVQKILPSLMKQTQQQQENPKTAFLGELLNKVDMDKLIKLLEKNKILKDEAPAP